MRPLSRATPSRAPRQEAMRLMRPLADEWDMAVSSEDGKGEAGCRWGAIGIRLLVAPPGAIRGPAGRLFCRSEDEVGMIEIGGRDTLQDEDVGAVHNLDATA